MDGPAFYDRPPPVLVVIQDGPRFTQGALGLYRFDPLRKYSFYLWLFHIWFHLKGFVNFINYPPTKNSQWKADFQPSK